MKKLAMLLAFCLALTGCAGGKFLGFLATTDYVDAQAKAMEEKQAAEIAALKAQLAEYQAVKDQAQAAIDQVNQTQQTIGDLQAAAQRAEQRIGSLPKEVIKEIVDILQAALQ